MGCMGSLNRKKKASPTGLRSMIIRIKRSIHCGSDQLIWLRCGTNAAFHLSSEVGNLSWEIFFYDFGFKLSS